MSDIVSCPNCGFRAKEGYRCGNCGDQISSSYTDPETFLFAVILTSTLFFGTFFWGVFTFYRSKRGGTIWWSIITLVFSILILWMLSSFLKDLKEEILSTSAKGYSVDDLNSSVNFWTFNLVCTAIGLILGAICFFKKIFMRNK